ncbi:MAG: hypothetical protein NXY57DRAFT_963256 [Lentinula lateritia]|nr:MAG: hypothetical protein NXY57DRAFT_963256 [Lentinula lateritia]
MNVDADSGRLPVDSPIIGHTLRTVSSNSSISSAASGASLNRQPRTRGRSRTVTGNSAIKSNTTNVVSHDQMPISTGPVAADTSRAEESNAEEPIRMTKAAKQASQLAAIKTKPPPSAFSRVPLSQIDAIEGVGVNVRDSMITQESEQTNISTVYPLSTLSSATASPRSPTFSERSVQVDDFKSFEEDDVSYRLRLLVNNNYFLPPAHSKPLPAQLIPATNPNAVKKLPAPTFLDLFRIGRSKSKPPTPTSESGNGGQALTPALRTTSDATAVSGFPMQMQNAVSSSSSPAPPRTSNLARPPDRSGRVVVVREKMADLASAAKQAEFEVKVRSLQRDTRREQPVSLPSMDDVIDPTDAVDLPLPSSAYPFAVQTSALHGLGVHESVGAAALASRLPPPRDRSSALSSLGPDDDEEDWKKALLKAAVGHSFDNLTVAAEGALARSPRSPRSPSSSMMSSLPPESPTPSPVPITSAPTPAARINKKIISSPIQLDTSLSKSPSVHSASHIQTHTFTNHPRPRGWSSPASPTSPSSAPSPIPIRTETPLDLMPLMPPPRSPKLSRSPKSARREIINPVYSISQTDLAETAGPGPVAASVSQGWYGGNTNHVYTMTPPPGYWRSGGLGMTPRDSSESSQSSFRPRDSSDRETANSSTSRSKRSAGSGVGDPETPDSISMYSTMTGVFPDEENSPRASSSRSTIISTAQSPTTSAFQDALSRNPSELRIDGNGQAHHQSADPPPVPSLERPTDGTSAPSASILSPFQPPEPIECSDLPALASLRPRSASSLPIPSTSLTPATPVSAPSRTTSTHYRDLRNRHFSALRQNNTLPTYASYLSYPPSAYNTNMPPPPTLAHRSASDHGHGSFTPPPPAVRKRPPTAPAAPMLTPRIELIEISAPEPTTPPFPSFASLPSFPSLPTIRSPSSSSSARSVHSARSAPPSPPSPLSPSSPSSPPSQSQLIERRQHGVGNPLRGSLHIPTSIIPPAIHSAPPPSTPPSFPLFAGHPSAGPSSVMMMTSPPSPSMSFFDTIQTQPNAMDYLDESSDESSDDEDDEDEDECEYENENDENRAGNENNGKDDDNRDDEGEEDFRTAEGGTTGGSGRERGASVTNSMLSSLSTYSTPSVQPTARRPSTSRSNISNHSNLSNHSNRSNRSNFSIRTPLMRLGNHSTPYVSHTSLHASDTGIDRRLPIGNIAESKSPREFFTKKMRDDEQVLESKWDLWKYTRVGQGEGVRADAVTGSEVETGTGPDIVGTGAEITGEVEVAAGPSSRSYSYSYSSHPYARAYGPHHSRNYSRDAPSSFAGISGSTETAVGGSRIRATSSSSDRGYGYGYGSQTQTQQAQTQAQQKMESKKLDGMLKMHMEAEKDQMKRMAERMKQTQVQDKASGGRGAIKSKR